MDTSSFDVIILGAGASGLFAGHAAAARGKSTLLIDHADNPGKKIRMAGGGKANFTNSRMGSEHYAGADPSFTRFALKAFTPAKSISLVRSAGIAIEEREQGQIFCKTDADILHNFLVRRCLDAGCSMLTGQGGIKVFPLPSPGSGFVVKTKNASFTCSSLIVATGSPARPASGASSFGLSLAKSFGHEISTFFPALSGFIMPKNWILAGLTGINLPVNIHIHSRESSSSSQHTTSPAPIFQAAENIPLVFTHKGVSGPAALQASLYWQEKDALLINFIPNASLLPLFEQRGSTLVKNLIRSFLPDRLAEALVPSTLAAKKCAELSRAQRDDLCQLIHSHKIVPVATEGFTKAEVARGGVLTADIHPKTMQSKIHPNLYFCGEVLDITGRLGGYNLHWAFASGMMAGNAAG